MQIIVKETYEEMSKEAYRLFKESTSNSKVIGFATGNTPKGLYRIISKECKFSNLSFKEKISFNLDEYYPIKPDDKESYRYYMNENLFKNIDIREENINFPDATLDENAAASRYKQQYSTRGPIDLQILGIGINGHIGFNEPGSDKNSSIRIVKLSKETIERNKATKDRAITLGIKEILESKAILLIASGADKSDAVKNAINGRISSEVPASFLQLHKNVTFVLDKSAASKLS